MMRSLETLTLGGGCFWCLEAVFREVRGVEAVVSGYAGGTVPGPSYQEVCSGRTGHAEVVQIRFDPQIVSARALLEVFFTLHDPTTRDRQGSDVGSQYRSVVFYHSPEQLETARTVTGEFEAQRLWPDPVVTQFLPAGAFHRAEDYHQDYFAKNPQQAYCQAVVAPKVAKFRKLFLERLVRRRS